MNLIASQPKLKAIAEQFRSASERLAVLERGEFHAATHFDFVLDQLSYLYRAEQRLSHDRAANPELPYDRFLLFYSHHYRRTREVAANAGIVFVPGVISLSRSLMSFDHTSEFVEFSPLRSELDWLLTSSAQRMTRLSVLMDFKKLTSCVFHELNHSIFFRHVQPDKSTVGRKSVISYFAFIEALVILRDLMLAEELGPMGFPLKTLGVVYRNTSLPESRLGNLGFEQFRSYFCYTYLTLLGYSKPKVALKAAGVKYVSHPALDTNQDFIDQTHSQWMKNYFKKYGPRLVLPKKGRLNRLKIKLSSDLLLVQDEEQLFRVYQWMEETFGRER